MDYDGDSDEEDMEEKTEASCSKPEDTASAVPKSESGLDNEQPEKRDSEREELPAAKRLRTEL